MTSFSFSKRIKIFPWQWWPLSSVFDSKLVISTNNSFQNEYISTKAFFVDVWSLTLTIDIFIHYEGNNDCHRWLCTCSDSVENAKSFLWISNYCIQSLLNDSKIGIMSLRFYKNESRTSSCHRILTNFILMEFRRFQRWWFFFLMQCSVRYLIKFP